MMATTDWCKQVALLTVLIQGLPQDARFPLFDRFRSDIGKFFDLLASKGWSPKRWLKECLPKVREKLREARGRFVARILASQILSGRRGVLKGEEVLGVALWLPDMPLEVPVRLRWWTILRCKKMTMTWEWQLEEDCVRLLQPIILSLPTEERYCLWALLDEELADYKDRLLATDPNPLERRQAAYQRMAEGDSVRVKD